MVPTLVLLWEVWWRPRRIRQQTAALLLDEVRDNLGYLLDREFNFAPNNRMLDELVRMPALELSGERFEIAKERLIEFPPPWPKNLHDLYRSYERLPVLQDRLLTAFSELARVSTTGKQRGEVEHAYNYARGQLYGNLHVTIQDSEQAVIGLHRIARPSTPLREYFRFFPYQDQEDGSLRLPFRETLRDRLEVWRYERKKRASRRS